MPWDETLIKDVEREFRQEGERAATRLAISFLMAREARCGCLRLRANIVSKSQSAGITS
jgi:hypothetical protein